MFMTNTQVAVIFASKISFDNLCQKSSQGQLHLEPSRVVDLCTTLEIDGNLRES